jgi:hypothetical protein
LEQPAIQSAKTTTKHSGLSMSFTHHRGFVPQRPEKYIHQVINTITYEQTVHKATLHI